MATQMAWNYTTSLSPCELTRDALIGNGHHIMWEQEHPLSRLVPHATCNH